MEASSEGGQGTGGAVVPLMEWNGKVEETAGVLLLSHMPHKAEEHSVRIAGLLHKNFKAEHFGYEAGIDFLFLIY